MNEKGYSDLERRQSFRLDMEKELIDLSWYNDTGQLITKKTACLDFSRGGIKLDCDQAIDIDTKLKVVFKATEKNNQVIQTKVVRCLQQDNGWYQIALQIVD